MEPEYRQDANPATTTTTETAKSAASPDAGGYGAQLRATRKPLKRRRVKGNRTGIPKPKMADDTMNTDTWRQLSTRARSVFMRLWSFAGGAEYDQDGAVVLHTWVSIQRLADDEGCSRRSVERGLAELEAVGLIGRQSGRATGQANNYAIFPIIDFNPAGCDDDDQDNARECRTSAPEVSHQSGESVAGVRQNRRTEPSQVTLPSEPQNTTPPAREREGHGGGGVSSPTGENSSEYNRVIYDMLTSCGVWSDTAMQLARVCRVEDVEEAVHDFKLGKLKTPAGVVSRLQADVQHHEAMADDGDGLAYMSDADAYARLIETYPHMANKTASELSNQIDRFRRAHRWWESLSPEQRDEALEHVDRREPCRTGSDYIDKYGEPGTYRHGARRGMAAYRLICEPGETARQLNQAYRR